jgi:hypothetical protein
LLLALTDDAPKWYKTLTSGADSAVAQFQRGGAKTDASLIVLFPTEAFAVGFALLMVRGPLASTLAIGLMVVACGVLGTVIINLTAVKEVDGDREKKPKKE